MDKIRPLSGEYPHKDWGSWENFLATQCEVKDIQDGVTYYGVSNCNYIVWPDGTMVQNYGYHGRSLMNYVKDDGALATLNRVLDGTQAIATLLGDTK